jgi:hypothetical protein
MEFTPNKLNDDSPIILPKKGEKRSFSTYENKQDKQDKNNNFIIDYSPKDFNYLPKDYDLPLILPEKIKKPSILELAAKNKKVSFLPNINS